ncbi:MAG: hypothetical protein ACI92G_003802 [Candidatus Pelagisphaera sp.]|jgi:hypothetical protein
MDYIQRALKELQDNRGNQSDKHMLVGLDGFVDTIIHLVGKRHGPSDDFTRIDSIEAFGNRILGAAGKSANIEMFPKMEKLGGNGPIMANALCAAGFPLTYIGALGKHAVLPVFKEFAKKTNAITVSDPGLTNALEFNDGKIMMGITNTLEAVTYEAIIETMGQGAFFDKLSRSSFVALVNWTMIPNMTAIFQALTDQVLPSLPPKEGGRTFFFDLADPEKRSESELIEALHAIAKFQNFGNVTLGLNLKEGQQVNVAFNLGEGADDADSLKRLASKIRRQLNIATVILHPTRRAACATKDGEWCVEGPYVENPVITTGAGDHFNAGFSTGQQLGLSPEACLTVGVSFSGFYVRTAQSPNLNDIDTFLKNW